MILLLLLVLWVSYASIEGKREAIFWHHRILSSDYYIFKKYDRHLLFTLQRGVVLILITIIFYLLSENLIMISCLTISNMLLFSFFHNGMMYEERNTMSVIANPSTESKWIYKKGWWDQSNTSTAKLTNIMTPTSRTIQALIGLMCYTYYIF